MTDAFLSRSDLCRLTGKTRFSAQRRALERLGVRFTIAISGEPLVRTDALDAQGEVVHRGPRWDRIASVRQLKHRAA